MKYTGTSYLVQCASINRTTQVNICRCVMRTWYNSTKVRVARGDDFFPQFSFVFLVITFFNEFKQIKIVVVLHYQCHHLLAYINTLKPGQKGWNILSIFRNKFSWMKTSVFLLNCHWFPMGPTDNNSTEVWVTVRRWIRNNWLPEPMILWRRLSTIIC